MILARVSSPAGEPCAPKAAMMAIARDERAQKRPDDDEGRRDTQRAHEEREGGDDEAE